MKVSVRVLVLLAAVLLLVGTALASENDWRLAIKADDGSGGTASTVTIGVSPTGSTGGDLNIQSTSIPAVGVINGTRLTGSKILPSTSPYPRTWYLRVAGAGTFASPIIQLRVLTTSSTLLPPETVLGGLPARYTLKMVDNKGIMGAPSNGTTWQLTVPAVHSTTAFFATTLPAFNISVPGSAAALLSEGYQMEFMQEAVPEPSSLMALGLGLSGLLAFRRRR